jgi:glycosyltransferase involved in cell wall biosynthesis
LKVVLKRQGAKVLHVVPGGSENKLLKNILNDPKHSSGVISLYGPDQNTADWCEEMGFHYLNLHLNAKNIFTKSLRILWQIYSVKPKLVFFHGFIPSFIGAILFPLCLMTTKIVPVRHHNLVHHLQSNRKAILVDRLVNNFSSHIVAVSNSVRQTMISEGCSPKKITVIHNAMTFENRNWESTRKPSCDSPRLLAIGRIDWQKNYYAILEMLQTLKLRYADVKLTVLGSGDPSLLLLLKEHAVKLQISKNIDWVGWEQDTFKRFGENDFLVHAALDEACPLVLIEGLILGIPIVSTQAGGSNDVLADFYEPCNTEKPIEFSNRICELWEDWNTTIANAALIRTLAKKEFNVPTLGKNYEDLVLKLAGGKSHAS